MAGESQKDPATGQADPTVLTTEALQREVTTLRDLIDLRIDALAAVTNEKFTSVTTQLNLIERQRVEQKKDTKDAVDAALAAAKEAVKEQTTASERAIAKSEGATAEQLKALGTTTTTAVEGVKANHDDLKERVGKIENLKLGAGEQRNAVYALAGFLAAALVILGFLTSSGVFR